MITELYFIQTDCTDPYRNLALEECLLDRIRAGQCILYLWQNKRTVVIGRNQNAAAECRIEVLEQDGGCLARRLSGGGAVYHDLGNLNFTFLMPSSDFDVERQSSVILQAVQRVGIHAEITGRNDLTVSGRKFSGHAYYHHGEKSYHHGTLMIDVDQAHLERYLNVPDLKLQAKGVRSVRSRVCNLSETAPALTIGDMKNALINAFRSVYACPLQELPASSIDADQLEKNRLRLASPAWKYGRTFPAQHSREGKFDWGLVRADYSVQDSRITQAVLWSDGLDAEFLSTAGERLCGARFEKAALENALDAQDDAQRQMAAAIASLLTGT